MGRMIHAPMWEDEFFTSMSIFDRLLWIGLITVCADDQGRLQDSPAGIRSKVFPVDDITVSDVSNGLERFYKDGKIVRYIVDKHKCIQIVNWWKHQKPQWAAKSIYPPHKNWTDKIRYHVTKTEIAVLNWKEDGGFPIDYIDDYIEVKVTQDVKVKVKVKSEDEIKDEVEISSGSSYERVVPKLGDGIKRKYQVIT